MERLRFIFVPFLLALFCFATSAKADTYIKMHSHTDGYYYGGRVNPAEDRDIEVWIGDERMSIMYEHRMVILDLKENSLMFINRDDSAYAETALPLDWLELLSEQEAARVQMFQTVGVVKQTRETKKIGGKRCKCYITSSWIPYEGAKYNERDAKIWMTTDVPFDLETFKLFNIHYLTLQNYTHEFVKAMVEAKGFPMLSEEDIVIKGFTVKSRDEVLEMSEKDAPPGVYCPPAGFTKKERLSLQDLRGS